ncbi:MAG TPA: hypothetical protein VMG12_28110, partial [Polyangiaceae bacterium]|nr:hypothetical protein [Polyangiaceae bacterium]
MGSSAYRVALLGLVAVCVGAATRAAADAQLSAEVRVNQQTDGIQQSASVAMDGRGGFVVAWQSEVAKRGDEIRARRFDARGAALGDEIAVNRVTQGQQDAPAVAMNAGGDFVVAWQTIVQNNLEVRARRFDALGAPLGDEVAVNTLAGNANSAPVAGIDGHGNWVVVWESTLNGSYEIRARRFDAQGQPLGQEWTVNTQLVSSQRGPALAMMPSGDFVVAWRSNVDGSYDIRSRRIDASGAARSDE